MSLASPNPIRTPPNIARALAWLAQAWQHAGGSIRVVSYEWFLECARRWVRVEEGPFELERPKNVNSVSVAPVLPKAPPAAAQAPPAAAAAEQQRGRGLSADDAFLATLAKEDKAGGDCGSDGSDGSDRSLGSSDEDDFARMIEEELGQAQQSPEE